MYRVNDSAVGYEVSDGEPGGVAVLGSSDLAEELAGCNVFCRIRRRRRNRWKNYKKRTRKRRAARKRKWRKYKKARRRRFRRFRKKWRKFWKEHWLKIASAMNAIGAALLNMVPFVGPALSAIVGASVQIALNKAKDIQVRVAGKKKIGETGYKAFQDFAKDQPDGVEGALSRLASKYGGAFVFPGDLEIRLREITALPHVAEIFDLEEQLENMAEGSSAAVKLEDEIDRLEEGDDGILDDLVDVEMALDAAYWAQFPPLHKANPKPKGARSMAKWGKKVDVWIDDVGDTWVRWQETARGTEPEGTEVGVWYRVTGDPMTQLIAGKETGSTQLSRDLAAQTEATRAAVLEAAGGEVVAEGGAPLPSLVLPSGAHRRGAGVRKATARVFTRAGDPMYAPGTLQPLVFAKKKFPKWAWALIGFGGAAAVLGGATYVQKRRAA